MPKESKDLYAENYKILMKEIKDDTNRWSDVPRFRGGRINILEINYRIQSNLHLQWNPYQTTNGNFHRTRTKNYTICTETQKTLNSQSNL